MIRLLQIRLKDLRNMVGEWELDLAHPACSLLGLLAFTGEPGSGQSSVLDAVTLALYGRLHDPDAPSPDPAQLISRQSGDCRAEAVIDADGTRFHAVWRAVAEQTPDTDNPVHELLDPDSGESLCTDGRTAAETAATLTGMTYEHFMHAVLLHAGTLQQFLLSPADQRARVLERLTDTAGYADLAVAAHERHALEDRRLGELRAVLESLSPLPDSERDALQEQVRSQVARREELLHSLADIDQALAWLDTVSGLRTRVEELEGQLEAVDTRITDFEPSQKRLDAARRAMTVAESHSALDEIRRQHREESQRLMAAERLLPSRRQELEQTQKAVRAAENELKRTRELQKRDGATIKAVRALDLALANRAELITAITDESTRLAGTRRALTERMERTDRDLKKVNMNRAHIQDFLHKNEQDGTLVGDYTGLVRLLESYREKHVAMNEADGVLAKATRTFDRAASVFQTREREYRTAAARLEEARKASAQNAEHREALLEGRVERQWWDELLDLKDRATRLREAEEALKLMGEANRRARELDNRLQESSMQTQTVRSRMQSAMSGVQQAAERVTVMERRGAPEQGGSAQGELGELREQLSTLRIDEARLSTETESVVQLRQELQETAARLRATATKSLEAAGSSSGAASPDAVSRLRDDTLRKIERIENVIRQSVRLEDQERRVQAALDAATQMHTNAENALQTARNQRDAAEETREGHAETTRKLSQQLSRITVEAADALKPYGIRSLSPSSTSNLVTVLRQRRDQWIAQSHELEKVDRQRAELEGEAAQQKILLERLDSEMNDVRRRSDRLREASRVQEVERRRLFRDRDPDREEQHIEGLRAAAEETATKARAAAAKAQRALEVLESRVQSLKEGTSSLNKQMQQAQNTFNTRLRDAQFVNEDAYRTACLTVVQRQNLEKQERELADEHMRLDTLLERTRESLAEEEKRALTRKTTEELEEQRTAEREEFDTIGEDIGRDRQRLQEDEQVRAAAAEHSGAVARQSEDVARWERLCTVVGAADGSTYRNAAQHLTFRHVVRRAADLFEQVSSRYHLTTHADAFMELLIYDAETGAGPLSPSELSPRSQSVLALCLGLVLGQVLRGDTIPPSLLIDGGFEALDDRTLADVLGMLDTLAREGTQIGFVSHSSFFDEWDGVQMRFRQFDHTRSIIEGPGCTRVDSVEDMVDTTWTEADDLGGASIYGLPEAPAEPPLPPPPGVAQAEPQPSAPPDAALTSLDEVLTQGSFPTGEQEPVSGGLFDDMPAAETPTPAQSAPSAPGLFGDAPPPKGPTDAERGHHPPEEPAMPAEPAATAAKSSLFDEAPTPKAPTDAAPVPPVEEPVADDGIVLSEAEEMGESQTAGPTDEQTVPADEHAGGAQPRPRGLFADVPRPVRLRAEDIADDTREPATPEPELEDEVVDTSRLLDDAVEAADDVADDVMDVLDEVPMVDAAPEDEEPVEQKGASTPDLSGLISDDDLEQEYDGPIHPDDIEEVPDRLVAGRGDDFWKGVPLEGDLVQQDQGVSDATMPQQGSPATPIDETIDPTMPVLDDAPPPPPAQAPAAAQPVDPTMPVLDERPPAAPAQDELSVPADEPIVEADPTIPTLKPGDEQPAGPPLSDETSSSRVIPADTDHAPAPSAPPPPRRPAAQQKPADSGIPIDDPTLAAFADMAPPVPTDDDDLFNLEPIDMQEDIVKLSDTVHGPRDLPAEPLPGTDEDDDTRELRRRQGKPPQE